MATVSKLSFAFLFTVLLSACAPFSTQSPSGKLRPVNAVAEGEDKHLMLAGHDVVAYFTEGKHRIGDPAIKSMYENVTFRFATAEHKAMFDQEPTKYIPQYGGYCANGIVYGIPWGGDADSWLMIDGKVYIFGGQGSRDAFQLDVPGNIALAEKYWAEEVGGANAFIQRSKRMIFRVPHYKSGEELAKEVAAKKG